MPDEKQVQVRWGGYEDDPLMPIYPEALQSEAIDTDKGPGLALMGCIVAGAIGAACLVCGGAIYGGKWLGWW